MIINATGDAIQDMQNINGAIAAGYVHIHLPDAEYLATKGYAAHNQDCITSNKPSVTITGSGHTVIRQVYEPVLAGEDTHIIGARGGDLTLADLHLQGLDVAEYPNLPEQTHNILVYGADLTAVNVHSRFNRDAAKHVGLSGVTNHIHYEHCSFKDGGRSGLAFHSGTKATVRRCYFANNSDQDIDSETANNLSQFEITDNIIDHTGEALAVTLTKINGVTFARNIINNGAVQIYGSTDVEFIDNTVNGDGRHSVLDIQADCKNVLVSGCRLHHWGLTAVGGKLEGAVRVLFHNGNIPAGVTIADTLIHSHVVVEAGIQLYVARDVELCNLDIVTDAPVYNHGVRWRSVTENDFLGHTLMNGLRVFGFANGIYVASTYSTIEILERLAVELSHLDVTSNGVQVDNPNQGGQRYITDLVLPESMNTYGVNVVKKIKIGSVYQ